MADDPRDKYREKHRTPPGGVVRAGTQAERDRAAAEEHARIDRLYGGRPGEETPVDMPLPGLIARTDTRTKQISTTASSIDHRVGKLETAVAVLGTKVDLVLDESKASREERITREAAAREDTARREEREVERQNAERAVEEAQRQRDADVAKAALDFRRQKWIDGIKIASPIIAAIAAIIAGLAGVFR